MDHPITRYVFRKLLLLERGCFGMQIFRFTLYIRSYERPPKSSEYIE